MAATSKPLSGKAQVQVGGLLVAEKSPPPSELRWNPSHYLKFTHWHLVAATTPIPDV
jgi:hypothetical protein